MNSLRNRLKLVFLVVAVLLGVTVLLGSIQYARSVQYGKLLVENEKILFRFGTLRETITGSLIGGNVSNLKAVIPELEDLYGELRRMQENPAIPTDLRIVMGDELDLAGLVIKIREYEAESSHAQAIQAELRKITSRLLKNDRVIVGKVRASILDLQLLIIGFMGIVITVVSFSLIMLYRNGIHPLFSIALQLNQENTEAISYPLYTGEEIVVFAEKVRELVRQQRHSGGRISAEHLGVVINEAVNRLNGIINYAQILADSKNVKQDSEERKLFEKMIESGVEVARKLREITGGDYDSTNSRQ